MENDFSSVEYSKLHKLQVGEFGEYWVKMWLTLKGFDTYTSEVDNKGIDFIIRTNNYQHIDIQVKTIRKSGYVYITKDSWKKELRSNLFLALVILNDEKIPKLFLIPSTVWNEPDDFFCSRDYEMRGKKSPDEWGINLTLKNLNRLEKYSISNINLNDLNNISYGNFK